MEWLRAYLSVPFKVLAKILATVVRVFRFNRAWLEARLARNSAAGTLKVIILVTVVAWFLIWLFAGDDYRNNLNQALESWFSGFGK